MSAKRTILALIIACVLAAVTVCTYHLWPSPDEGVRRKKLVPGLMPEIIDHIEISDQNGGITLEKEEGEWFITHPVRQPADDYLIRSTLLSLEQTMISKSFDDPLNVAANNSLAIGEKLEGVSIKIASTENGTDFNLILGNLDFPEDVSDHQMIGAQALARRFVRTLSPTESVALVDDPLTSWQTGVSDWAKVFHIQVNRFKEITILHNGKNRHIYFRKNLNGPIYSRSTDGLVKREDPYILDEFESFLSGGIYGAPQNLKENFKYNHFMNPMTIVVTDFSDLAYEFHFGSARAQTESEINRQEFAANMISPANTQDLVPYTLRISSRSTKSDLRFNNVKLNLEISEQIKGMYFEVTRERIAEILKLFDSNENNPN